MATKGTELESEADRKARLKRKPKKVSKPRRTPMTLERVADQWHESRESLIDVQDIASAMERIPETRALGLALGIALKTVEREQIEGMRLLCRYRDENKRRNRS